MEPVRSDLILSNFYINELSPAIAAQHIGVETARRIVSA